MSEEAPAQKTWTLRAVRAWSIDALPGGVRALPDATCLNFVDIDSKAIEHSRFRLPPYTHNKLLVVGTYDDEASDPQDRVLAFVYGKPFSHVGYLRERDSPTAGYSKLDACTVKEVEFGQPLYKVSDGRESQPAVLQKLKTVICYSFLASGHITHFGASGVFMREFRKACLWIANGGIKPDNLQLRPSQHPSSSRNPFAITAGKHTSHADEAVLTKIEDTLNINSDDDVFDHPRGSHTSSPSSTKPTTNTISGLSSPSHSAGSASQDPPTDRAAFDAMLQRVSSAYETLETGNKRLKLSLDATQTRDKATITALTSDIATLRTTNQALLAQTTEMQQTVEKVSAEKADLESKLHAKEANYDTLVKLYKILKLRLAAAREDVSRAERRAKEAEETADKRFHGEREEMRALVGRERERAEIAERKVGDAKGERLVAQLRDEDSRGVETVKNVMRLRDV